MSIVEDMFLKLWFFVFVVFLILDFTVESHGLYKRQITTGINSTKHCNVHEYGPQCTYCVPHETCAEGHYTCDTGNGSKICSPGYTGNNCTTPVNPGTNIYHVTCPENECRNGGSCLGGSCCCLHGFTGILCEVEIIECQKDSCLNGGVCKDLIGEYECMCKSGFVGKRCENVTNTHAQTTPSRDSNCQSNTCRNNGKCYEDAVFPYCLCPTWFDGRHCEIDRRPSNTAPVCPEHHYGPDCKTMCYPQDSCSDGHYICHPVLGAKVCLSGWRGSKCDIRVLPQSVDPECNPGLGCKNDGRCHNHTCCCRHNFTGDACEIASIGCVSSPCQNNATCLPEGNGYTCLCPANFTGKQCEAIIVPPTLTTTPATTTAATTTPTTTTAATTTPPAPTTAATTPPPTTTAATTPPPTTTAAPTPPPTTTAATPPPPTTTQHKLTHYTTTNHTPQFTIGNLTTDSVTNISNTHSYTNSLRTPTPSNSTNSTISLSNSSPSAYLSEHSTATPFLSAVQSSFSPSIIDSSVLSGNQISSSVIQTLSTSSNLLFVSSTTSPSIPVSQKGSVNIFSSVYSDHSSAYLSTSILPTSILPTPSSTIPNSILSKSPTANIASKTRNTSSVFPPTSSITLNSIHSSYQIDSTSTVFSTNLLSSSETLYPISTSPLSPSELSSPSYFTVQNTLSSSDLHVLQSSALHLHSSSFQTLSSPVRTAETKLTPSSILTNSASNSYIVSPSFSIGSLFPTIIRSQSSVDTPSSSQEQLGESLESHNIVQSSSLGQSSIGPLLKTTQFLFSSSEIVPMSSSSSIASVLSSVISASEKLTNTNFAHITSAEPLPSVQTLSSSSVTNNIVNQSQSVQTVYQTSLNKATTSGVLSSITSTIGTTSISQKHTVSSLTTPRLAYTSHGHQTSAFSNAPLTSVINTLAITPAQTDGLVQPSRVTTESLNTIEPANVTSGPLEVVKTDSGSSSSIWKIVVITIGCCILILLIIALILYLVLRQRKKDSRTLQTTVADFTTFDKEHFSVEPEFTNPTYELDNDSDDDSVKHDMYIVNE